MSGNQDQIDYWNGPAGQRWAEAQESDGPQLSVSIHDGAAAFRRRQVGRARARHRLRLRHHDLRVRRRGGTEGHGHRRRYFRADARRGARDVPASKPANFVEADASVHTFAPEFDAVTSRFGVMFFADPLAAFANIRKALKPGGRLAFVCWRAMPENVWAFAPFMAARDLLPAQPPPDPNAPGPFAFADPVRLRSILEGAGFKNVKIEKLDTVMHMAATAQDAAQFSLGIGPLARAAAEWTRHQSKIVSAWRPHGKIRDAGGVAACCLLAVGATA